ncbi:MAG: TAT-variant-translocated molybdopterin oxidoreductase, partial [Verrucomicrobiales bacterium]|nr:TAT-variant-translocated molybdopterin oxidoreductase [Verrucomicrobiales bacterium]
MKRIWHHPEEPATGKRYWRSTGELEQRSEFLNNLGVEFPAGDTLTEEERENSRREFLKVMGAATGLMGLGLASCRRPSLKIMPYTDHVEWVIPGKPLLYATSMPRAGGCTPLVVTTHEGRPTHVQGNPLHPFGGGVDAFAQASVLDLYDPERSQRPLVAGGKSGQSSVGWGRVRKVFKKIQEEAAKSQGSDLAILVGDSSSPSLERLLRELKTKFPKVGLYRYEALSGTGAVKAQQALMGARTRSVVRFSQAKRILALDCDFLGLDPVAGEAIKEFSKQRSLDAPGGEMNRLYAVENRFTVTGGMADHRKPLAASLIPVAAAVVAAELGVAEAQALAKAAPASLKEWLAPVVADLKEAGGNAAILAGSRYGAEVHALVAAANAQLGAFGKSIQLVQGPEPLALGNLADLQKALAGGTLKTLVSLTPSNLLFDAPQAAELGSLIRSQKVALIHHGLSVNHTARAATLHLPAAHYLEAWGDVRAADGTYSVVQPMIEPLYDGVSELHVIQSLLGKTSLGPVAPAADADPAAAPAEPKDDAGYTAVRETFAATAGGLDETKWNYTLRDGFLKGSAYPAAQAVANTSAVAALIANAKVTPPEANAYEVVLVPSSHVWDGRHIGNAWLQEAPDPITRLTWDNAALLGARTFRDLGLEQGQMIKITVGDQTLRVPAIEAPGHVAHSITLEVGYGQHGLGYVASNQSKASDKDAQRGFDAYRLRKSDGFVLHGAQIEVTEDVYPLAVTQDQNTMEGRAVYREGTLEEFSHQPDFAQKTGMDGHIPPNISFYKGQVGVKSADNPAGFDYERDHQWGMTIDLSKCIGCTSCIVACQSENNIPVVGKDQVQRGRVMQWIRMDRYFATYEWGTEVDPETGKLPTSDDVNIDPTADQLENPEMVMQPVACQQCESAPCETVCPVNATVHTEEGLNAMAYNRCIG